MRDHGPTGSQEHGLRVHGTTSGTQHTRTVAIPSGIHHAKETIRCGQEAVPGIQLHLMTRSSNTRGP
eukprot:12901983-Prorocentrum_lima.AAC.1